MHAQLVQLNRQLLPGASIGMVAAGSMVGDASERDTVRRDDRAALEQHGRKVQKPQPAVEYPLLARAETVGDRHVPELAGDRRRAAGAAVVVLPVRPEGREPV